MTKGSMVGGCAGVFWVGKVISQGCGLVSIKYCVVVV